VLIASLSQVIDVNCARLEPIQVGRVLVPLSTPDLYVTVADDHAAILRVDVYAFGPDTFAFQDALLWQSNLVIGFGSHVHAISMQDRSVTTIELGSYFGHLYPTSEYLLIASGERLFRMDAGRSVLWKTDVLAVDGVVVHDPGPPIVRGDAEHDPPGGWQPFAVLASNGHAVP
jgi:hypothetical protein